MIRLSLTFAKMAPRPSTLRVFLDSEGMQYHCTLPLSHPGRSTPVQTPSCQRPSHSPNASLTWDGSRTPEHVEMIRTHLAFRVGFVCT